MKKKLCQLIGLYGLGRRQTSKTHLKAVNRFFNLGRRVDIPFVGIEPVKGKELSSLNLFSCNTDIKNVMISIAIASHSTFHFSIYNNHIKSL